MSNEVQKYALSGDASDQELMKNMDSLTYEIHKYSSYSTNYYPWNIYKDEPSDPTSRWSSDSSEFPQFLVLRLQQPSVVKVITFGKYLKAHVCNVKKFRVYGGLSEDNMILLLESSLKNGPQAETFPLRHSIGDSQFPIKFLKIMPLQTWGSTFNFSIWYVALKGCGDWKVVQSCINGYSMYREKEALRLCLKHLRERRYTDAYHALLKDSGVALEDPFLTEFYERLVTHGDYNISEEIVQKAFRAGYFEQFIRQLELKPKWVPIAAGPCGIYNECPGMRGGHQMCIDVANQMIYLFGGWDGTKDLSDLWAFNISAQEWVCLSRDTQAEGGPSGRSCHKMCLDPKRRQIFTLGRFMDPLMRTEENLKSDFFLYDIESNSWTLISEDTASVGGPAPIFDHQIAIDVDNRVLYVFGGRVVTANDDVSLQPTNREHKYSGLYSYHVSTSTWAKLRDDGQFTAGNRIKGRIGHSMLFHHGTRELFILGGQRNKDFLTDFFTLNVDSNTVSFMSDGSRKCAGSLPSPGFTQKATIDTHLNEVHILAGLSKEKNRSKMENVRNSFWIYQISQNKWTCVYHNELSGEDDGKKQQPTEPCPRYAYQLVYDDWKKVHYLFGGNPGNLKDPNLRLDDFWAFYLSRPSEEQLLKNSLFLIRKTKYKELALTDPLSALDFLRTSMHAVVDHENATQVKEFQSLASTLFESPSETPSPSSPTSTACPQRFAPDLGGSGGVQELVHEERLKTFQQISLYLPEEMTQPRPNLVDFVPY